MATGVMGKATACTVLAAAALLGCVNPPVQNGDDTAALRTVLIDFRTKDSLGIPWGFDPRVLAGDVDLLDLEAEDLVDIGPGARQQRAEVATEAGYAIVNAEPVLRCAWGNMSPEAFFGDSLYRERRIELGCFEHGEMSVVVTSRTRLDEKEGEGAGPDSSKTLHLVYAVNRGMSGSAQRFEYELRKRDGEWVVAQERLLDALD